MEKLSPTVKASYELLRATPGSPVSELKKRFHEMALLYHPDRNSDLDAPEQFRRVTEAYELLLNQSRVRELNQNHLRERLHQPVVQGLTITFGTFFGFRIFYPDRISTADVVRISLTGKIEALARNSAGNRPPREVNENHSILDHSAYDAIEVIYAGKLNRGDEESLRAGTGPDHLTDLPWVRLNNRGILQYLDGDFRGSERSYRELCERVPGNIVFIYRLAVCLIIDGFKNQAPSFFFGKRPDPKRINEALMLLRLCIRLGHQREVGRQKCLVIQKTLADVLELIGKKAQSRKVWREILEQDAKSGEATFRVKGIEAARKLFQSKTPLQNSSGDIKSASETRLLNSGKKSRL